MRIILATPIYPPEVGGPATYVVELAERLRGSDHVVIVAYTDNLQPVSSTHLIAVSKKHLLPVRLVKYFFALLREAKQSDLIYVQNAVAAGLPAALVGMWLKKPVILKFVGDEAWERASQAHKTTKQLEEFYKSPEGGLRTRLIMRLQRFVLTHVSIVTTPSAYLSELLITYYGVEKSRVVVNYNAVAQPPVVAGERMPHQIMTGVRLVAWKGVDGIIRAIALLKEKFPNIRLMVAGEGPERKNLEDITRSLGVEDHVKFLGRLSHTEITQLQSESAAQVVNSRYEGMPHGVLESFATKTPIIATNIPGTNEAVLDGKTGLLVEVGNDTALAAAIEKIFTNPELCAQLVKGGEEILKEKFSWETHIQRLREMFGAAEART